MASYEELRKQRERKQVREGSAPYVTPQINPVNTGAGSTYERLKLQREVRQNPSYVDIARKYGEYVSSAGDRFAKMQEEANKQYNLVNDAYKRDRIAKVNPEITNITGSPRLTAGGAISVNNAADILEKQREAERLEREKAANDRRNMYAADLKALDTNSEAYKKGLAEIEKIEKFYQVKKDNPNGGLIINKLISPNMYEQQNTNGTEFLTDQERALYAYYLGMGEKDKAAQYLEDIQLNARRRGEILKATEQDARNNPGLNSVASAIYNTSKPIEGAYDLVNRLTGEKLPEASSFMISGDIANRQRDTVREKINNPVGGFLYDTGMSAVDSLMAALLPGGLGSLALGASAMRDAMTDAAEKGATTEQIVMQGLAQGIAEALFEKISIGELKRFKEVPINGKKDILFNFLKSTFTNASEEGLTELSNVITDYLIMGKNGDNPDAKNIYEAVLNSLDRIGLAALGGGLMGGPFSFAGSMNSYIDSSIRGRNVTSEDLQAAMQYGREYNNADINRMAASLDAKQATGSKVTDFEKGNLMKNVDYAKAQEQNKVLNMLRELQQRAAEEKKTSTADKVTTEENKTATEGTQERTEAFDKEAKSFYGKNGQKVLEENWARNENKMSRRAYENAIYDSYMQGKEHRTFEPTERSSVLSEEERKLAYNAGVQDRWDSVNKGVFAPADNPGVIDSDDARDAYTKDKAGFEYADTVAKLFGAQINYNYGIKGNGLIMDGNKISLSPNSAISYKSVANHEFTHMLEITKGYEAYRDYVMGTLYKNDKAAVDAEVSRIINLYNRNGVKLDYEGAVKEMLADAAENFLNSEESINKFMRALGPDERTVVQKIIDFFKEAIAKLKAAIRDTPAETQTGKMLRADLKAMQHAEDLWIKAAAELKKGEAKQSQGKAASISEKTSVENVLDEIPVKKSFSITDPVEQTDDLVAIHNLDEEKLKKAIKLGGFPMPSIAVVKANIGHVKFGDYSVVFYKDTIDPKNKKNHVYGADAWTPTFPRTEYEISKARINEIQKELEPAYKNLDKYFRDKADLFIDNLDSKINSEGGLENTIENALNNEYMKRLYLAKDGITVADVKKIERKEQTDQEKRTSQYLVDKVGLDTIEKWLSIPGREAIKTYKEDINAALKDYLIDRSLSEEKAQEVIDKMSGLDKIRAVRNAKAFAENGGVTETEEIDAAATQRAIDDKINEEEFRGWLKGLFEGLIVDSGLYNGSNFYTASGRPRSFQQTHYPVTLENIVKAMLKQGNGNIKNNVGFVGSKSVRAAITDEFKNIKEIKKASNRMRTLTEEEFYENDRVFNERLSKVINRIVERTKEGSKSDYNYFISFDEVGNVLLEATTNPTKENILKAFEPYIWKITEKDAQEFSTILNDIKNMPVNMFEAKPERAIYFNEVATVAYPSNIDAEFKELLANTFQDIREYKAGDDEDRKRVVNSTPDIQFSITEDSEGNKLSEGQQEYFKDSKVRDDQGRLMKMYHGTPNGTFTVFKGGSYFTNMAWYAERYQSQGASSLSYKKTADNPKTYEAYLNIIKPFDTRDPKVRKIWDDQYYQKWDTGDLAESGLPDWTAAEGLLDFIEENELDFDGLIIDEGGIPGDNGEVISRGFAWVPVNGREQVKSVDNLNPTDDPDIRYSITEDSEGNKLSEGQQEYFAGDSPALLDKEGKLKRYYHGTQSGGFTIFSRADDGISFFFTDDKEVARSYSGTEEIFNPDQALSYEQLQEAYLSMTDGELLKEGAKYVYEEPDIPGMPGEKKSFNTLSEAQAYLFDNFVSYGAAEGTSPKVNYAVYLRATNPLIVDAKENFWNELPPKEWDQHYSDVYIDGTNDEWEVDYVVNNGFSLQNIHEIFSSKKDLEKKFGKIPELNGFTTAYISDIYLDKEKKRVPTNTRQYAKYAKKHGYDAVIFQNIIDNGNYAFDEKPSEVVVVFDPSQIKSVNNLNPTDDPDIRYSITDLTPEEIDKKLEENRKLKSKNRHLEKLYENAKKQVRLTKEFKASDAAVNKIAKETLKEFNSTFPVADFANTLHEVYEYIYNNERKGKEVNLEEVSAALTGVMEKVLEQSVYMDETDQAVRDALKGKTLIVTDDLKKNITDWNDFRREASMFKIRNGETSNIDSVYDELHDQFPWLFDTEQNVTLEDMLYDLVDTYEAAGPKSAQYGDMKEIAAQTAINLIDRYSEDIMEKPTFADKKKEQLKRLKAEHKKELFEARADLADTFAKVLSHRELDLSKYEDKMLYKRVNQEQRWRKEYIDSITKSVQRLREKLFANNEKKHIPAQYVNNIAMLLNAIDLNTNIPGTQVAEQLAKYKDMYKKILESNQGEDHMLALDDGLPAYVEEIISMLGDKPVRNLGSEVLQKVSIVLHVVEGTVKNANNAFLEDQSAKLTEKGSEVLRELDAKPGKSTFVFAQKGPLKELGDLLRVYNVTPAMFYDRLSGPLQESFKTVRNAEGKYADNIQKATDYALEMMRKYNFNDWYSKAKLNDSVKTFNIGGKSITLDRGQIMSLYVTWQREAGKYHITHGGINSDTQERVGKLKVRDTSEAIALTEADYKMITDTLTQEQKDFADAMRDYLAKECSKQGNEVTLALWQIKKYGEDKYFPIPTTGEFNYKTAGTVGDTRIKHSSFTKSLVQKASNPISLFDFMTIWSSHVDGMAKYNAYTLPLEGMTRLWNYKEKLGGSAETHGPGQRQMSVRGELKRVYGTAYNTYILNFINDVNGSRPDERGNEFGSKLMSLMKKASVMGNARVVIQQPSAIVRAFAYIDPKYFTNKQKGDYDELAKWNSAAKMKRMGFFDTGMGGSIVDELKKGETRNAKEAIKDFVTNERGTRDDVLSKGAELADEITWAEIWKACKAETAATTDLEQDSEAFMKHASARFTEIVDYTQVYDSVFEKSDIMRSSSTFAKMVTAFMSEPTKTYSMLWRAAYKCVDAGDDKELKKEAKKYLRKALIAILGSWIVNDALTSVIDVSRKGTDNNKVDNEYEWLDFLEGNEVKKTARIYIKTWLDSFRNEPASLVPYLKDIMSIFSGYEVKRTDMQLVQSFYWAWTKIDKKIRKEPDAITVDDTVALAGSISAFFGIPVSNVYRDLKSAFETSVKMVKDLAGITDYENSFEGRFEDFKENADVVSLKRGDDNSKAVREFNELLFESIENGKLEDVSDWGRDHGRENADMLKTINSKFKDKYESDIAIAAAAYKNGQLDVYEEMVEEFVRKGYDRGNTVEKVINNKVKQLIKEEKQQNEPEEQTPEESFVSEYYGPAKTKGSKSATTSEYKDVVSAYSGNNRSTYTEAVKKAKASGLNTSTVKAQLTTARRKTLAENADFNKLIQEAMNGDTNFINTYKKLVKEYPYSLASMDERKDDLAAVALRSELFNSFKAAVAAGDKEGMKKYGLYLRKLTGKELSALRKLATEE